MGQTEKVVVTQDDVRIVGQVLASPPGQKAKAVLARTFGSRLSYTRGEPEHTAFLEGQKSVIQFIENAVSAAVKAEDSK